MQLKLSVGLLSLVAIWGIFTLSLPELDTDSLWYDEAWTVYAVSPPPPTTFEPPRGVRARVTAPVKAARDDLFTTLERVREDVHPPLYFVLLDAWTFAAGDSVFALRYVSLLVGLMGATAVYTLGRQLFNPQTGLYALVIYGSGMLFVYYTREARMYTLLMTLAIASTLAYTRLTRRTTWQRGVLYAAIAALGLYTHYAFALVIAAHGVHGAFAHRNRLLAVILSIVGTVILFAPYLPIVLNQLRGNPGGALAAPIETSFAAVSALGLLITGGWWWLYALLLIAVVFAVYRHSEQWRALLLVALWLILTPAVLLVVNAVWMPLYQVRYVLGALPAVALLLGFGLGSLYSLPIGKWLAPLALLGVITAQITAADGLLPAKSDYDTVIARAAQTRDPLDPIVADIAQRDPVYYYNRVHGLTQGVALDLSWRDHTRSEIEALVARLADAEQVWMVMPTNVAKTWHVAELLHSQGRTVGYQDGIENVVIYRFDAADSAEPFVYHFINSEDEIIDTYTDDLGRTSITVGESLCVPITLEQDMALSLTVVRGYNTTVAQWNGTADETEACIELADNTLPGEYHVYLTLYDETTGERYAVMQDAVWWGWWVVTHTVEITNAEN